MDGVSPNDASDQEEFLKNCDIPESEKTKIRESWNNTTQFDNRHLKGLFNSGWYLSTCPVNERTRSGRRPIPYGIFVYIDAAEVKNSEIIYTNSQKPHQFGQKYLDKNSYSSIQPKITLPFNRK
jgi:hypothetical protein